MGGLQNLTEKRLRRFLTLSLALFMGVSLFYVCFRYVLPWCLPFLLALLIAWCFGGFMEGMAGFGTAVAIPASMLAGLGFAPIPAVLLCLLANGVPTPYGSIGIPTVSLAGLVGLDSAHLAFVQMVQLAPFYIVAPFLIVLVAGKVEGASVADRLRGVVVPTLAAGLAFALPTMAVAAFVGPELSVVVGSICALAVTALLAMRAEHSGKLDKRFHVAVEPHEALTLGGALRAWSCFILIFILLMGTSKLVPFVNSALAPLSSSVQVFSGKNPGTLSFMWVNTPGIWIFLAAIVGGFIQGARPAQMLEVLGATVKQMMPTVITMLSVLGCAKVMGYSGMISSISAFCIGVAGAAYPFIAPWIGAVGTFSRVPARLRQCFLARCKSRRQTPWAPTRTGWLPLTCWASRRVRCSLRSLSPLALPRYAW